MRNHPLHTLILVLFPFLLLPKQLSAQEFYRNLKALNSFYLEAGGNGDTYSLNYDRVIYQSNPFKAGIRAGVGTNLFFLEEEPGVYPIVPIEAIGMVGRKKKHFEFGIGYTRRFTDDPNLLQNMYFGRLGFRYHEPRGGLVVRVAVTPFISPESNQRIPGVALVPRFGLSVGRSF